MTPFIQAENISKSYGIKTIFKGISLVINEGDKMALIARNGEGKTTLLNTLSGKDTPDSGVVTFRRDLETGYLEQEPVLDDNLTVIEQVFASSKEVIKTVREYEEALAAGDTNRIDDLTSRMDALQAWDHETRAKQILTELDITEFGKTVGELSGGQKKRVALARVLIDDPEMLILDEPTNHLDTEMTGWLENYLGRSRRTIVMVTHDRYFLDRVCNLIIEMDNSKIYKYSGNYSYYVEKRAERLENMQAATDRARNLLRKELEWMRRMPKARTGKSKSRIDNFYELREKASASRDQGNIKIKAGSRRLGKKIVELEGLNKSYGELPLIRDFSYTFSRFEKVGIIGRNGTGKSTLLNIITGDVKPDSGRVVRGETVHFGYYRQEGISFDEGQTVIEALQDIAEVVTMSDGSRLTAGQLLSHFLFPPPRQHDYIGKLSGGEKRRLYLATVLMRNPNFLLLDEPTNDLDIETLNILEDYLAESGICLLVVSHDRFFLDKVADHIFVFEGEGVISDFPGNYTQYSEYLRGGARAQAGVPAGRQTGRKTADQQRGKASVKRSAVNIPEREKERSPVASSGKKQGDKPGQGQKRKLSYREQRELEQLEKEIGNLEKEKASVEEALSGGNLSAALLQEYSQRYADISAELEIKSDRWLELGEFLF